ncbi:MAG: cyclase family protein, partial [Gemmatimonadales bacterium]
FWEGKMYGGRDSNLVTSNGARAGAVDAWSTGITTRGVLLDIPRLRGTGFVTIEEPVRGWELEAAAESEGVEHRPGDAVIVYSGRPSFYRANPENVPGARPSPGLHVDTIPVLRKHDAALLGWDMMDASPTGYELFDARGAGGPVHVLAIVYLGLPLMDNSFLEPLAQACAEEGRYEFLLTVNPLNVRGGTGSPVNPIAIF